MKLLYVANALMPTDKGYGAAILNACAAFSAEGVPVRLVVAHNPLESRIASNRHLEKNISIQYLPSLWLYSLVPNRAAFAVQSATFYISVFFWTLFKSRRHVVYTRDSIVCLLSFMGFRVVYESHHIPRRHGVFFALVRRASKVVVISRALEKSFVAAGFAQEKILVAPSGVSLEVFSISLSKAEARAELDLALDDYLAVYTGNFTTFGQDKGIEDIIQALVQTPQTHFVAVGGSPDDIARYNLFAKRHGVADRVNLLGAMGQEKLAVYQKAADVLLMPFPDTPHYRNFMSPVKMFEYMASERPVIASDLPTIREVLTEENAFIVPPGDPAALAAVLEQVRANSLGAAARAKKAYADVAAYAWRPRAKRVADFILAPARVTVLQLSKLGDMVCTTPVFAAIKRAYPQAQVVVVGTAINKELLAGHPHVDEYVVWQGTARQMARRLRALRLDVALITSPGTKMLVAALLARVPLVVCPRVEGGWSPYETRSYKLLRHFAVVVPHRIKHYAPREYLRLLEPLGIYADDVRKELAVSEDALLRVTALLAQEGYSPKADFILGIAPSAGANKLKSWGPGRFAALAEYFAQKHNAVIAVIAGKGEKYDVEQMLSALPASVRVINFCSVLSIEELKALISLLSLFISSDTGPVHIAEAFDTPLVNVLGAVDEHETSLPGPRRRTVFAQERGEPALHVMSASVYDPVEVRRQTDMVTVEMVIAAAEDLLKAVATLVRR